jgi:hypothetical protein
MYAVCEHCLYEANACPCVEGEQEQELNKDAEF